MNFSELYITKTFYTRLVSGGSAVVPYRSVPVAR